MKKIIASSIFVVLSTFAIAGGEIVPTVDEVVVEKEVMIEESVVAIPSKSELFYTDHKSKLMWQDEAYGDREDNAYKHSRSEGKAGKWDYANNYCQELYYAGYLDWRLPKITELVELYSKFNHLKNTLGIDFWSSTPSKGNTYWSLYGVIEGQPYAHKKEDSQYIRCVRSVGS